VRASSIVWTTICPGKPLLSPGRALSKPAEGSAVNEHVYLNGDNVPLDIVLSVGSGHGDKPQNTPSTSYFLPEWIHSLFQTFLETMNSERSWGLFLENAPRVIKSRARRLNPHYKGDEPPLDAVDKINSLAKIGQDTSFAYHQRRETFMSRPLIRHPVSYRLLEVALSLRASLFYFELQDIKWDDQHRPAVFVGAVYCRLDANTHPFRQLLAKTSGFRVNTTIIALGVKDARKPFRFAITIKVNSTKLNEMIYVEANFSVTGAPRAH
jgi:hypothetical protein